MTRVAAAFARALTSAAGLTLTEGGVVRDGARIVRRLGPDAQDRLPDAEHFALIEWIGARYADPTELVFAYARAVQLDHLGVLGLALKTAPTLRGSLRCIERYFRLLTDTAAYRLEETGGLAVFSIEACTAPHPALSLRNECALAALARCLRRITGEGLRLDHVSFRHACTGDPARYAERFGCPVRFGAERDALAFAPEMLDRPNRLGDAAVAAFMTRHLDADLDRLGGPLPSAPDLRARLLPLLSERLGGGAPAAAEIARELGMSERTLYRRLAEDGLTYRDVLAEAQTRLARNLLEAGEQSLAEIAFLTGFSEQSAFARAFKRQAGQTPARFRSQSLARRRGAPDVMAGSADRLAGPVDTGAPAPSYS
ncbi:AraC family transcriptional regulator ligand-binding domain-containing protein [Albimonas sp. CAU 1670]|uniref:AraC family transcriptional regulator n=1 Tax=Albimonas sp. CAU 1670 TaxID=3032599 RepID=UPI0023DCC864|nr:AraC family transcriptional regulator [Albimonas sp. CAU 1670]MDF2235084.1 AraC family transcriptional regulator ligand-binding domain-containing protein [Albimonas sp. CAU 1670]